jgi:hypothetical protein
LPVTPGGHQREADLLRHVIRRVVRQPRPAVPENDRPQRTQHGLINTILTPHGSIDSRNTGGHIFGLENATLES